MHIRSVQDVQRLGRIMGVWAHPDDETFSSAGIMAAAVQNGQEVVCLTATRGEAGVQDDARWPKEKLAQIREKELEDALMVIGVENHEWLEYQDGCCCEEDTDKAVKCICSYVKKYQPDTILTFGQDGLTGHPDHKAVGEWATKACNCVDSPPALYQVAVTHEQYDSYLKKMDEKLNIFFNINKPKLVSAEQCDIYFRLTDEIKDRKYAALKAMPSQTEEMMKAFDKAFICKSLSPEAFVRVI